MSGKERSLQAAARKRESTCNAILDATSQLIAERGVQGFTISDVAERGKVNRALIYHYYRDRDNLIFETIRHIVKRYDELRAPRDGDELERTFRLHIEHPEIGRFFFHLIFTGKHLPRLSHRLINAIEQLEKLRAANATVPDLDPTVTAMVAWLMQLSWSCSREEIARLLGLSVDEADRRFIAIMRTARGVMWPGFASGGPGPA